jgi:FtsH-binding integral membrane protein
MFIGHFGVGLGAKKPAPFISLGTLFLAAQFLDLLWPTFVLLGWEHVIIQPGNTKLTPLNFSYFPFSHSLLMAVVWGIFFGLVYFMIKRNYKGAVILGLCVLSHWVLDLLVHRPDLPLFPGNSPLVGFGWWNYPVLAVTVESLIFIIGLLLYLRATKAKNKVGSYAFWALILFLVLIYISNLFGPSPTSVKAVAWAAESQWLLVIWAYWIDRNRMTRKTAIAG